MGAWTRIGLGLAVLALASGCATADAQRGRLSRTLSPDKVDFGGLADVRIGQTLAELTANGKIDTAGAEVCGPQFADLDAASPVFADGRLVLLWAYPPLRTPEGVGVGSPVADARLAYAGAVELAARPGTFAGLLVPDGRGNAYLLLYDAGAVQKLIVGVERYARLLHATGFGTC